MLLIFNLPIFQIFRSSTRSSNLFSNLPLIFRSADLPSDPFYFLTLHLTLIFRSADLPSQPFHFLRSQSPSRDSPPLFPQRKIRGTICGQKLEGSEGRSEDRKIKSLRSSDLPQDLPICQSSDLPIFHPTPSTF